MFISVLNVSDRHVKLKQTAALGIAHLVEQVWPSMRKNYIYRRTNVKLSVARVFAVLVDGASESVS